MDENESKLKNILGRLSELDAAVQALPDFAVETPEPLETEPLASGGGFQYLHGDGIGEPFLTGARVRYECNSSGVVKAGHDVGTNITPGGFYYTIHLDNGMKVTALPESVRAQVPRKTTRRDAPGLHDLGDGVYETDSTFQTLETEPLETEPLETEPLEILQKGGEESSGEESSDEESSDEESNKSMSGGGWITNSRMENLEWRVEALDSQFNEMNSNFIKILKILEDSIEKRHDLKKTTDVGDDTDDAPDHRDVSSALNDAKYNNLAQKLRRVADGPRVLLKASPR